MASIVADTIARLEPDTWRTTRRFSPDVKTVNDELMRLISQGASDEEISRPLRRWLQKNQPCLFGRFAAGDSDLLSFCILTESDLEKSDEHIRDKIKACRWAWKASAALGKKSGFIIVAVSRKIMMAPPSADLKTLAKRLCALYLRLNAVEDDEIYTDDLFLEVPAGGGEGAGHIFKWRVGVNFFGAQADGRWWHDHRIPGGIAFSMNSVGHMVRSGALHNMKKADGLPGGLAGPQRQPRLPVDSLSAALRYAMLTINNAQDAVSGKATCLRDVSTQELRDMKPECPMKKPVQKELDHKNYRSYLGWYNTDVTIPGNYFLPDVARPAHVQRVDLSFDYLFDADVDNPDFETTGTGEVIRGLRRAGPKKSAIWGRKVAERNRSIVIRRLGNPEERGRAIKEVARRFRTRGGSFAASGLALPGQDH